MEAFVEDVKGDVPWEEKTGETLLWVSVQSYRLNTAR